MSEYLTSQELADLIGYKPNQRSIMKRWLDEQDWKYVVDRSGFSKAARLFRDQKLGILEGGDISPRCDVGPMRLRRC
jgi:hypothetical protein